MSSVSSSVLLHSIGDSVGIVVLVLVAGEMGHDLVLHGELLVIGVRHCVRFRELFKGASNSTSQVSSILLVALLNTRYALEFDE